MSALHLKFFLDLNRVHAIISRRFDAQLGGVHGIGLGDLHLLDALARAPDHRLRRVDLAQQLGVTASGVTWMLRPLTKRGLVTSEASSEDARVSFAVLTEAGRRLVAEAVPSARRVAASLLDGHLSREELAAIDECLSRLG